MNNDYNLTAMEVEQIRRENKKSYDKYYNVKNEFKIWFIRGVALTLAFTITSGVIGTGIYLVSKKVIEYKVEKMIEEYR